MSLELMIMIGTSILVTIVCVDNLRLISKLEQVELKCRSLEIEIERLKKPYPDPLNSVFLLSDLMLFDQKKFKHPKEPKKNTNFLRIVKNEEDLPNK